MDGHCVARKMSLSIHPRNKYQRADDLIASVAMLSH
jgi:hypothetical protein